MSVVDRVAGDRPTHVFHGIADVVLQPDAADDVGVTC